MISNSSLATALQIQASHRHMLEKLFPHCTQIKLYKKPNISSVGGLQKIFFFLMDTLVPHLKLVCMCRHRVKVEEAALCNKGKLQFKSHFQMEKWIKTTFLSGKNAICLLNLHFLLANRSSDSSHAQCISG